MEVSAFVSARYLLKDVMLHAARVSDGDAAYLVGRPAGTREPARRKSWRVRRHFPFCASATRRSSSSRMSSIIARCVLRSRRSIFFSTSRLRSKLAFFGITFNTAVCARGRDV